jgi:hypothetical protein
LRIDSASQPAAGSGSGAEAAPAQTFLGKPSLGGPVALKADLQAIHLDEF